MTKTKTDKLFDTGWTGGPSAVSVAVYADHAVVQRWDNAQAKSYPLTSDQVARLRGAWADANGDTGTATAVALSLNSMTGHAIGRFSSMAGGEIGEEHTQQMRDIEEMAGWRR